MPGDISHDGSVGAASFTEPTLGELLGELWTAKRFVLAGALAGLVAAFVFMALAVPHYRASMLVAPVERRAEADAGAPDVSGAPEDYARFENMLREPSVAAALLKDTRIVDGVRRDRRFVFMTPDRPIGAEALSEYLQDHVRVEPVGTSPLRRIVYDHPDRDFAVTLLGMLHVAADGIIRQDARDRAAGRARYLEKALDAEPNPDHRRALAAMLMEQEQGQMILAMDEPFAASIAEPPSAGVRPQWPKPSIVFPVFVAAGMMLGFAVFGLRRAGRRASG